MVGKIEDVFKERKRKMRAKLKSKCFLSFSVFTGDWKSLITQVAISLSELSDAAFILEDVYRKNLKCFTFKNKSKQ